MKVLGLITHNFPYKCAALFVAIILWAATQGFRSVEQSMNVPVTLENYDRDAYVVVEQSAQEVNLRIMGSQAAVRRAGRALKRYPVSLARVAAGELRLSVDPDLLDLPRGARVSAWSPQNLLLRIEPVERKVVPVRPDTFGHPAQGFRVVAVEVEPREIALAGARSSMSRLREVFTERIDLSGLHETMRFPVQLALGRPHVWREDGGSAPLAVVVRVEPVAGAPSPGEQTGRSVPAG